MSYANNTNTNDQTPVIHKRSSSLPQTKIELQTPPSTPTVAKVVTPPVLPLKLGRHSKSLSVQIVPHNPTHSRDFSNGFPSGLTNELSKDLFNDLSHDFSPDLSTDLSKDITRHLFRDSLDGRFSNPSWQQLRANTPPIPKRHSGRLTVDAWLGQNQANATNVKQAPKQPSSCNSDKSETKEKSDNHSEEVPSLITCSESGESNDLPMAVPVNSEALHARHVCIRELYYTEKQFSRELGIAVGQLIERGRQMGIPERHLAIVFSNLPQVFDISHGLVALLEQFLPVNILTSRYSMDEHEQPSNVGRAMCLFLNSDMYRVYECYVRNHRAQTKAIHKLARKYPEFNVVIGENSDHKLSLRSLLHKPVQRLSQYSLLLKHIMELLPYNHLDHKDVTVAYERSQQYCYSINARL